MNTTIGLALALALSIVGNVWQIRHAAISQGKTAGDIAVVKDANESGQAAIADLQNAVADCYAGRVFDRAAATMAANESAAERDTMRKRHDHDTAQLTRLLAGECREWAAQPACGVIP